MSEKKYYANKRESLRNSKNKITITSFESLRSAASEVGDVQVTAHSLPILTFKNSFSFYISTIYDKNHLRVCVFWSFIRHKRGTW